MEPTNTPIDHTSALRRKALHQLERMEIKPGTAHQLTHELQVHQIELEMQNEDLRQTQLELEESRNKYFELYDLAPVGYLTLERGVITNANLAVAGLLDLDRKDLIEKRFSQFVVPDSQDDYYHYINQVSQNLLPSTCELKLNTKENGDRFVQLSSAPMSSVATQNLQLRLAITDITTLKLAEKQAQDYQKKLKSLTSKLTLAEEHLKNHIATQLHDHVSQSLAMLRVTLGRLAASSPDTKRAEILQNAYEELGLVLQETRDLTSELSFPALRLFGLKAVTQKWAVQEVQVPHGIEVRLTDDGVADSLDQDVQAVLFRGIRELLINVIKHAQASCVEIHFTTERQHLIIMVKDNGIGMDASRAGLDANLKGFGILSVTEALEGLGGSLLFDSSPSQGCIATITAPLQG